MSQLRVIIADDERPARNYLRSLLESEPDVEVVGEAENGSESITLTENLKPDLLLLDLQMPELNGIEVARMLNAEQMPLIAFVTAYDEYAVKAFDLNAVDYLLKPVDADRLKETISRVRRRLSSDEEKSLAIQAISAATEDIAKNTIQSNLRRIPVRRRDDIIFVNVKEVASVVAEGELLHIFTMSGERFLVTYRLKDLEARLDDEEFIRISRGVLVNANAISKVNPMPGGTYLVTLTNRQEFPSSRSRSRILRETVFRL